MPAHVLAPPCPDRLPGSSRLRAALHVELDRWLAAGRRASLWWRDDDTTGPGPRLTRLLDLGSRLNLPVALAAIPHALRPGLAAWLAAPPVAVRPGSVGVLQHGCRHRNNAGPAARKSEFVPAAPPVADLRAGWRAIRSCPGARPVLVPPWNRIAPQWLPRLPGLGYTGFSAFGARATAMPVPGLRQVGTHIDPVAWRTDRGLLPPERIVKQATDHLRARRLGTVDPAEPTGFLTHHRMMNEDVWAFTGAFLQWTSAHPAVDWLSAAEVFP